MGQAILRKDRHASADGRIGTARRRRQSLAICALISMAVILAFAPVVQNGFIELDDAKFIFKNVHVREGLSLRGIRWALTSIEYYNWHPVTWIAYMVNVELFGLRPLGHHVMSVASHAFAAALFFLLLRRLTGALWSSAFAAALFAVHPLRTESVAWAAEIKDPLSGCFSFLTLLAYARFAGRPSYRSYGPVAVFFLLGLMTKPMLVTLPCAMLLLDFWPLGRWQAAGPGTRSRLGLVIRLLGEKTPLLFLSAGASLLTYSAQAQGGAIRSLTVIPLPARIGNALLSALGYLRKIVWPADLAVLYPYPSHTPPWQPAVAALALLLATGWTVWQVRRRPYLIVGWLWFLGLLVPVAGFVQVGVQAMADRFTYLPFAGIALAASWGFSDVQRRRHHPAPRRATAAAAVIVLCVVATRVQTTYWRSGETLFRHALAVTKDNWFALYSAGVVAAKSGRFEEAVDFYRRSLAIMPSAGDTHLMLGNALSRLGRLDEAIAHYRIAQQGSTTALASYNLGLALSRAGRTAAAAKQIQLAPGRAAAAEEQ